MKAEDSTKKKEAIEKMNQLQFQKLAQIEANEDKKNESKCKSNYSIEIDFIKDQKYNEILASI